MPKNTPTLPPLPGSREAVELGCTCPVMDNCHGKGMYISEDGHPVYAYSGGCLLHAPAEYSEGDIDEREDPT